MNKDKSNVKSCAGAVMPLVMFVLVILLVVGVGLGSLEWYGRMLGVRTTTDIAARSAADAGLTKAVFEMNQKLKVKPWNEDVLPQETDQSLPNSEALFTYGVTGAGGTEYNVVSEGTSSKAVRKIYSTLRLRGPFEFAVFAKDTIELKNGTIIDGFNFDTDDENLKVGTNSIAAGAVTLNNSSVINGDVVVGVGGDPAAVIDMASGVTITGRTYAQTQENELPDVTVPSWLVASPSGGVVKNATTISTSGRLEGINVGNNEVIVIDEPVTLYVTGDITLGNDASLQIGGPGDTDNDASLVLYVGGSIEGKNSCGFNNLTRDATCFEMYGMGGCTKVDFKNSSDFYGAIYAPEADLVLRNSGDVYGSIVVENFELKNSANIYYDAALRDKTQDDSLVKFVVKSWREE